MKERVLLLGAHGFVGRHMSQVLDENVSITATGREVDIRNKAVIHSLVDLIRPTVVVNFAFITTVRETFADPYNTYQTGLLGMLNLLEGLKAIKFSGRILNISSSEVYGFPDARDLPIVESAPLKPMSPYSVAKISAEALGYQWFKSEGMDIVTARPFTHIGPGQTDRFALSSFSKQLAEMALGLKEPVIEVGNLNSTRDITDVRDIVRAYCLLLDIGEPGEIYNVCSGREVKIRNLLDRLIELSEIAVTVKTDTSLVRSTEQHQIFGSYKKLFDQTGWSPEISLDITPLDMIEFWKKKLG